jgi:hypothetical protein
MADLPDRIILPVEVEIEVHVNMDKFFDEIERLKTVLEDLGKLGKPRQEEDLPR